jgi:hypothetical protein
MYTRALSMLGKLSTPSHSPAQALRHGRSSCSSWLAAGGDGALRGGLASWHQEEAQRQCSLKSRQSEQCHRPLGKHPRVMVLLSSERALFFSTDGQELT